MMNQIFKNPNNPFLSDQPATLGKIGKWSFGSVSSIMT